MFAFNTQLVTVVITYLRGRASHTVHHCGLYSDVALVAKQTSMWPKADLHQLAHWKGNEAMERLFVKFKEFSFDCKFGFFFFFLWSLKNFSSTESFVKIIFLKENILGLGYI